MTYCLALKVKAGLLCLADGRITTGTQVRNAHKASLLGPEGSQYCVMTSGLRSLRDKTLAYLEKTTKSEFPEGIPSMLEAVSRYAAALRQVAEEDRDALANSELTFNLHTLLAGQLPGDENPTIYLVYPEGNWIEVDRRTPYLSIGATAYGKPILDRVLDQETSMRTALKVAYLSFDSTRVSSADVGYPVDFMTYFSEERRWREAQYDYDDLRNERQWWNENITRLAETMPDGPWLSSLLPETTETRLTVVRDD